MFVPAKDLASRRFRRLHHRLVTKGAFHLRMHAAWLACGLRGLSLDMNCGCRFRCSASIKNGLTKSRHSAAISSNSMVIVGGRIKSRPAANAADGTLGFVHHASRHLPRTAARWLDRMSHANEPPWRLMMREVRMAQLEKMASPIRHVMAHIHEAIVNIAPEQRDSFASEYDDFVLEYLDDHRWICDVNVANRYIRLSRKVMEVLWAASFAYFRLYLAIVARTGGRASVSAEIEFANEVRLGEAADLLRWAMSSWLNRTADPWPRTLPAPFPHPPHASDEHVADELSLCAVAVILHHEFNHIRLQHQGASELDSERDADHAATDWVLGQLEEQDDAFKKRALGVATALAVLVAKGIHTRAYGGDSHPRSFDRLMYSLDRRIDDPNHQVWFFVAAILKLHLDNASHGAEVPDRAFDSGQECVDAYVDALSRIPSRVTGGTPPPVPPSRP